MQSEKWVVFCRSTGDTYALIATFFGSRAPDAPTAWWSVVVPHCKRSEKCPTLATSSFGMLRSEEEYNLSIRRPHASSDGSRSHYREAAGVNEMACVVEQDTRRDQYVLERAVFMAEAHAVVVERLPLHRRWKMSSRTTGSTWNSAM